MLIIDSLLEIIACLKIKTVGICRRQTKKNNFVKRLKSKVSISLFFFSLFFQDEYNLNPGLEWEDEFQGKISKPSTSQRCTRCTHCPTIAYFIAQENLGDAVQYAKSLAPEYLLSYIWVRMRVLLLHDKRLRFRDLDRCSNSFSLGN